MRTMTCTTGETFTVDDEDFEELSKYKWYYNKRGIKTDLKGHTIGLSRLIMPPAPGLDIDHINGNKLDNRKCNLQAVTGSVNSHRRHKLNNNNTTGFRGVSYRKNGGHFVAKIRHSGIETYIGCFKDAYEAARAYDAAAIKYFGSQALTNESLGLLL